MREQYRFPGLGWVPLLAGILWLAAGVRAGLLPSLLLLPLGGLLLACGVAQVLWAGDRRITQTSALGSMLALFAMPLLALGLGFLPTLGLGILALASLLSAGALAVHQEGWLPGVPRPEPSWRLSARIALDEWVLGLEQFSIGLPTGEAADRLVEEIEEARSLYRERGWAEDPGSFHLDPPKIEEVRIEKERTGRLAYEHLAFESLYEPHPGEPGRDRWLSYGPTHTAHAYLLRHAEGRTAPG